MRFLFIIFVLVFIGCKSSNVQRGIWRFKWKKDLTTGKVTVMDMDGKVVCTYYEPIKK